MTTLVADPSLFAAFAIAVVDDPDLVPGTHVRLLPSPALGLPIGPFLLWGIDQPEITDLNAFWTDSTGHRTQVDQDSWMGDLNGAVMPVPPDIHLAGVQVLPKQIDHPFAASLLDKGSGRIISARSTPLYSLAAPLISKLRLNGQGPVTAIKAYSLFDTAIIERILNFAPDQTLSLPVDNLPWYGGALGRNHALGLVRLAAPRRLGPPDRPDGPFDSLPPRAELIRVGLFTAAIDAQLHTMLGDAGQLPRDAVSTTEWLADATARRPWQSASFRLQDVQAFDPGVARYLGLLTTLRLERHLGGDASPDPVVYIAAGLFAVDRTRPLDDSRLIRNVLGPIDQFEQLAIDRIVSLLNLQDVAASVRRRSLELRALVALAAAVPPPDPLTGPEMRLGGADWIRDPGGQSSRYRQSFFFENAPLASLVAMGRLGANGWETRHALANLPPGARPAQRAIPIFLAQSPQSLLQPIGFAIDENVPASGAPWRYRFRLGDLFGRYGGLTEVIAPAPPRPRPPTPAPQAFLHPNPPAVGEGAAVFGTLEIRVPVPNVQDLTSGSLRVATVTAQLGLQMKSVSAADGITATIILELPALLPMESRNLTLTVQFFDAAGTASLPADQTIAIADPRAPPVIPTGLGIIWTSRPGPASEVEMKLTWSGQTGVRYRAYLADAKGLDIPLTEPGPDATLRSRAAIAVDGGNRARAGNLDFADRFRLLTDPPIEAGADGNVVLSELLPQALSTVQFLRIVPISAAGAVADFKSCGVVSVAVPSYRRPPSPRVSVTVNADAGTANIAVEATGLDLIALRAAEPGLFTNPVDPTARPPEFRLRRASGPVTDPIYAREIARGLLQAETIDGSVTFRAVHVDAPPGGLLPFVEYAYWAEIRMPPERRLPLGMSEVLPVGGAAPIDPSQAADMPGEFSTLSAPFVAIRVPAEPPALTVQQVVAKALVVVGDPTKFQITLSVTGGPVANPKAVGTYRLSVWQQSGSADITQLATELLLTDGQLQWTSPPLSREGAAPPVEVFCVLIDPIDRAGPIATVPVLAA